MIYLLYINVSNNLLISIKIVAPEIVKKQSYTKAVDMWSAGVILYFCLCGSLPFIGETDHNIKLQIKTGEYSIEPPRWDHISKPAKNLINALLTTDPQMRLTAEEALVRIVLLFLLLLLLYFLIYCIFLL